MLVVIHLHIGCPKFGAVAGEDKNLTPSLVASCNCFYSVFSIFRCNYLGCMNTRRVKHDHLSTPQNLQNTNSAGGRGCGRGPQLGRRTLIDDLIEKTDSSNRDCH